MCAAHGLGEADREEFRIERFRLFVNAVLREVDEHSAADVEAYMEMRLAERLTAFRRRAERRRRLAEQRRSLAEQRRRRAEREAAERRLADLA